MNEIITACRRPIPDTAAYRESAWRALDYDTREGVLAFWEPHFDYDAPSFWESYDDVTPAFIYGVRLYDAMQHDTDDDPEGGKPSTASADDTDDITDTEEEDIIMTNGYILTHTPAQIAQEHSAAEILAELTGRRFTLDGALRSIQDEAPDTLDKRRLFGTHERTAIDQADALDEAAVVFPADFADELQDVAETEEYLIRHYDKRLDADGKPAPRPFTAEELAIKWALYIAWYLSIKRHSTLPDDIIDACAKPLGGVPDEGKCSFSDGVYSFYEFGCDYYSPDFWKDYITDDTDKDGVNADFIYEVRVYDQIERHARSEVIKSYISRAKSVHTQEDLDSLISDLDDDPEVWCIDHYALREYILRMVRK